MQTFQQKRKINSVVKSTLNIKREQARRAVRLASCTRKSMKSFLDMKMRIGSQKTRLAFKLLSLSNTR